MSVYFKEEEPEPEPEDPPGTAFMQVVQFFSNLTEPGGIWRFWKL